MPTGYPPSSVRSQHTTCKKGKGGGTPDQDVEGGAPSDQRALSAHGMQEWGGGTHPID